MMKAVRTYVVVADGASARFFVNEGIGKGLNIIENCEFEHHLKPTRELGTERPGRQNGNAAGSRHSIEPHVDWHDMEKDAFAQEIAKMLNSRAKKKEYDRLVLVAPSRTLNEIKDNLHTDASNVLSGEVHKDLTHTPQLELPDHLKDIMVL